MPAFLTKLKNFYINKRGFHTKRKLVVFESDDWGSIRMPSKEVFEKLKKLGDNPDKNAFLSNDCLENESDLNALYDVLSSVVDSKGNNPIFTLNFAMANPNFDKIDIEKNLYEYELFYDTYKKYYGENRIMEVIKEGLSKKLIRPQLHCREHLNVGRWMRDLRQKREDTLIAFECKTMGIGSSFHRLNLYGYMDSFNTDCCSNKELSYILDDAAKIFADVFGYKSSTFVASCFVWNDYLEECLVRNGIRYIQSGPWQNKPIGSNGDYNLKRVIHYTGQKNNKKVLFGVRNCSFEPAYNQNATECVHSCLGEIKKAFKAKKPAIINTHRLNYIGSINPNNRAKNLSGLKRLLELIMKEYPDVEFVSTEQLYDIMVRSKNGKKI